MAPSYSLHPAERLDIPATAVLYASEEDSWTSAPFSRDSLLPYRRAGGMQLSFPLSQRGWADYPLPKTVNHLTVLRNEQSAIVKVL